MEQPWSQNMTGLLSLTIILLSVAGCRGQVAGPPCDITCEEIVDPLCHFQTYTYTGFPNLLGHTKQGYIQQYDHLMELLQGCYDHSIEFLCGIMTPHCVENHGLMLPTKTMCEEFHEGCDEFLEEAGTFNVDCNLLSDEVISPAVCIHFPTRAPGPVPMYVGPTLEPEPVGCVGSAAGNCNNYFVTLIMISLLLVVM